MKGACFLLNGQMPLIVALRMRFNPVKRRNVNLYANWWDKPKKIGISRKMRDFII